VKIDRNDTRPIRGFFVLNCFCLRIKPFLQREKPLVCLELLFDESETLNITTFDWAGQERAFLVSTRFGDWHKEWIPLISCLTNKSPLQ
jgi:hypothetical protein